MLDADARKELYQISLEPIYIDRYVGLGDLLDPASIQQHKSNGIAQAGAFKRLFEQSFDPNVHTSLQRYVAKATETLSSRTDGNPEEDLYFYCPYCEYYATDQVVSDGITIAQAVLGGGQTGPGNKLLSDGTYTEVTVSDDYAMTTPTIIVTTEPQGIIIPEVNAVILICETAEAGQAFRCCSYTYEGDARYSDPFDCYYTGGSGGGGLEPRIDEDWLDCEGFSAVYTGHIQSTKRMDAFLSVTDGGGNEMRLARIGAGSPYTVDDGQIETNAFAALLRKYITRGRISNEFILTWGVEFDPGWECDEPDQLFVLYEEDENSTSTFSGSIGFTPEIEIEIGEGLGSVTLDPGVEVEIGFEIEIEADDDVIWQQTYSREEYFSRNRASRGCQTHPILETETVFDDFFDHDEYCKYSCDEGFVSLPDVHFD
ncbi:MAG: hypothetical protein AB8F78_06395 [Saprospiraceae bacterium]